jgi:transcriptional regulator of acetoin/glycerol metabolism
VILCRDGVLNVVLPEPLADAAAAPTPPAEAQRRELEGLLQQCGWRIRGEGGAAERLGIKPTTLEWRLKKLGIHRPR